MEINAAVVPDYLDLTFFKDALENGLSEENVYIKNIIFGPPNKNNGDNYCSFIYRLKVNYQKGDDHKKETISLLVKSNPLVKELLFVEDLKAFHKEKTFYLNILPRLEILLNGGRIAPRCFYATKEPVNTLVFQDMSELGYTLADREIGLDESHARLVLKKLGQFHAVSMVFAKKEPSLMSHYASGFVSPKSMDPSSVLYKLFRKFSNYEYELISKWEGYGKIAAKLKDYNENFATRLCASQMPEDGELKVLNHGDLWTNNCLFIYEGGAPKDMLFIDYQMSIYSSPGIDLNYFFYSSLQIDVLKKWKQLLETYHTSLKDTLEDLRYRNIPTLDDIVNEFKKRSSYGLFTIFGPMVVATMDKNLSENSFEKLGNDNEKIGKVFSSERLIQHLKYSYKNIDEMGGLDAK